MEWDKHWQIKVGIAEELWQIRSPGRESRDNEFEVNFLLLDKLSLTNLSSSPHL
jgi:hypothetical protein